MADVHALRAEADAKDDLAERVRAEAKDLPTALQPVVSRMGPEVWRGPAADEFEDVVRRGARRLDSEAGSLERVAARLNERADQLRARALELQAQVEREAAEAAEAASVPR